MPPKRLSDISYKGEFHHATTVGLRFAPIDAYALRALARRDGSVGEAEQSLFAKAANCAAAGELLVVQCGQDPKELAGIIAQFPIHGVRQPSVEPLRVDSPVSRARPPRLSSPPRSRARVPKTK